MNVVTKMRDLYSGNCKTLEKETEGDTYQRSAAPCLWTGTVNAVNMSTPLEAVCVSIAIPIKIPMILFKN